MGKVLEQHELDDADVVSLNQKLELLEGRTIATVEVWDDSEHRFCTLTFTDDSRLEFAIESFVPWFTTVCPDAPAEDLITKATLALQQAIRQLEVAEATEDPFIIGVAKTAYVVARTELELLTRGKAGT